MEQLYPVFIVRPACPFREKMFRQRLQPCRMFPMKTTSLGFEFKFETLKINAMILASILALSQIQMFLDKQVLASGALEELNRI